MNLYHAQGLWNTHQECVEQYLGINLGTNTWKKDIVSWGWCLYTLGKVVQSQETNSMYQCCAKVSNNIGPKGCEKMMKAGWNLKRLKLGMYLRKIRTKSKIKAASTLLKSIGLISKHFSYVRKFNISFWARITSSLESLPFLKMIKLIIK